MEMSGTMSDYQAVRKRAERTIKDELTKEHIRDFVKIIPSLPAVSTVLTPAALEAAVTAIERAQVAGGKKSVIAAPWGAWPLVAKVASQPRSAAILEDALPRTGKAAKNAGRMKDYREAKRRLANPDPEIWMPALVEISVMAAADRNGYSFQPYVPVARKNHDLVLLTPGRQVHLDCLCITRTMVDRHRRFRSSRVVAASVDPDVDLVLGKIRDKAPQLRVARGVPKGVIIAYSGFGTDRVTTTMGLLEAINAAGEFRTFSVLGVTNGTAATGVMWFFNPRADIPLCDEEWQELTKVFPGVRVRDYGYRCGALANDLTAARQTLDDLDFRFLHPSAT